MAPRRNKKNKRPHKDGLFPQAQRAFEKRNYKQALKDAKVCFRQEPAENHRQLLEKALCARGTELLNMGLAAQAREVAEDLLELGITVADIQDQAAVLCHSLGIQSSKAPVLSADVEAVIAVQLADRAVVKPQSASALSAEARRGVNAIRQALEAVEQGREPAALAILKEIPRNSPFADWKLFARGLAAYYREDNEDMRANWDRLDPNRPAAVIAGPLKALAEAGQGLVPEADRGRVGRMERSAFQTAMFSQLGDLQRLMVAEDCKGVLRNLKTNGISLRKLDPDLKARFIPLLVQWGSQYFSDADFREMTRCLEPVPLDPLWNRAWAFFWEGYEDCDVEFAEQSWRKYLNDLPRINNLSAEEQQLAAALVCLRVARLLVEESESLRASPWADVDQAEELEELAEEYFTRSIQHWPTLREAYHSYSRAQKLWEQPERAQKTMEQLLEHVPDDADAIIEVGLHHLNHGDPFRGRELIKKARKLKPLDQVMTWLVWSANLRVAREHALHGQWDDGRKALEEAAELDPSGERRMELLCRKAVFEIKAGRTEEGQRLAGEAQSVPEEPAPALMLLAAEGVRYHLPDEWPDQWTKAWDAGLKQKFNTATAARMCELMQAYLGTNVTYKGREHHVQGLVGYLGRSTRFKFQPDELMWVCKFLDEVDNEPKLLEKLVKKGRKSLADFPYFHLLAGQLEMRKGPKHCNRRAATKAFEQALATAEGSEHRLTEQWVDSARHGLTFLREVGPARPPLFGGGHGGHGGSGPLPENMGEIFSQLFNQMSMEDLIELIAEDGMEDEDDDDESSAPRSRQKKKKVNRKG